MKSIIIFIVGACAGLVIGAKLWYDYVRDQVASNVAIIVDNIMTEGVGTWSQQIYDRYQWQAQQAIESQKKILQAKIEQQIKDYLHEKINGMF